MSLDLFRPAQDDRAKGAGRRLSALPISVFAHVLMLLALVVIPLLATDILPQPPSEELEWMAALPAPPTPPAPARPRNTTATLSQRDPNAAPREAPSQVLPESGLDQTPPPPDPAFDKGVIHGGIEGGAGLTLPVADTPPPPPVEPVRPGGNIKEPRKIVDVTPSYPDVARAARVEGIVILEAVLGPDGLVRDVRVLRSMPLLDEAAMTAVRQWRYTPTLLNGVPVPVVMTVTVSFKLR